MMKLILLLSLLWMLSGTDGAFQCVDSRTNSTCESSGYCAAAAIQDSSGKHQSKSCVSSSFCKLGNQTFSCNFGFYNLTALVHCCNTRSCNSENVAYPDVQTKKTLKCFTCDDGQSTVCNKTVQCVGVEDRCIRGSVAAGNSIKKVFGCASRNLCEAASEMKDLHFLPDHLNFTSGPKCCGTNLCNSAWTVKLNVVPFMLGLIMPIVWQSKVQGII